MVKQKQKKINSKECLNTQEIITDTAKHWNNHIRAQICLQKLKQEQAILYSQSFRENTGWKTLWIQY